MISRQVREGRLNQGSDERVSYTLTTTPWGSSPTSPSVAVFDLTSNGANVTTSVMPTNAPSVLGDVITLSQLRDLIADHLYRVEVKFNIGATVLESWFEVWCDG